MHLFQAYFPYGVEDVCSIVSFTHYWETIYVNASPIFLGTVHLKSERGEGTFFWRGSQNFLYHFGVALKFITHVVGGGYKFSNAIFQRLFCQIFCELRHSLCRVNSVHIYMLQA